MLFALIVMPRSRSRSMESRTCACISRSERPPVISISRSASVDLPWSMCAMMQKFRSNFGSMCLFFRRGQGAADSLSERESAHPPDFPGDSRREHTARAQNRCLGKKQFATNRAKRQPLDGIESGGYSAAKLIDEPENQANDHADDQTRDQWEVKCAVLAAVNNVAGQPAQAERKLPAKVEQ